MRVRILAFTCATILFFPFSVCPPCSYGAPAEKNSPVNAKKLGIDSASSPNRLSTTPIVINITVNTEEKGDYFALIDDAGTVFLKGEDLRTLNLKWAKELAVQLEGDEYVPLSGILDVKHSFDEKKLALSFIGKTTEARKTSVDIFSLHAKPQNVYYPRDTTVFFNYGFNYSYSDPFGFQAFSFSNKIGARAGDVFFTSDSLYTKTEGNSQFVRLQTSATYERRDDLQWYVLGDQFANSGDLGSVVNMGGIGFSKLYKLDPYLITQPMFNLNGVIQFPSEADIYVDGVLVSKQQLPPGQFELKNVYSNTGSHNVDIVLKDPFGNVQKISYPFYFNTQLLRQGLHEYSYNIGFLRERYGVENNDYGKPVFSAFHRYGVNSAFNIGARAEGSDGLYNGGLTTAFLVPRVGAFAISVAGSTANGLKGSAASLLHSYQFGSFSTSEQIAEFSRDYATVNAAQTPAMTRYAANLNAGFQLNPFGSFSLGYSTNNTYSETTTRVISANYSKTLSKNASLYATASSTKATETVNSLYAGITFNFDTHIHGSIQANKTGETNSETVQLQKDNPIGEGVGYHATVNRSDAGSSISYSFNPGIQYNGPYGIYTIDSAVLNALGKITENYIVSASGALVYAGGFFAASRPVNDSFTIVMADNLANAAVFNNGQEIGKTNSSGTVVVPTLTSYGQNQITLDAKNISMDYTISGVNAKISPSVWSGSCVSFDAYKVHALTGTLVAQENDKKRPLEFVNIVLNVGAREIAFPTGKGGEFYLENRLSDQARSDSADKQSCRAITERKRGGGNVILPGKYSAKAEYEDRTCEFSITFPKTDEPVTDVGEVQCVIRQTAVSNSPGIAPVTVAAAPQPAPVEQAKHVPVTVAPKEDAAPRSFEMKIAFSQKGTPTTKKSKEAMAYIVRQLKKDPQLFVEIEGHADRHGSEKAATRLALLDAERTKAFLIQSGLKQSQIRKVESMGRKQMICAEETTACDRMNRRIVIKIVGSDQLPIPLSDKKNVSEQVGQ